jgi:hypothetical protein
MGSITHYPNVLLLALKVRIAGVIRDLTEGGD